MLTDYSKKNSKISFCRHLSNFENWISRIFSENPEAFEERVNKLIKEKEEEKEQRRKDAERALQEAREKRAKVKQFNSVDGSILMVTFLIIVISGSRCYRQTWFITRKDFGRNQNDLVGAS